MSHCLDNSEGPSFARSTDTSSLRNVAGQTYTSDSQGVFRFPFDNSGANSSLPGLQIGDCGGGQSQPSSDGQTVNLSATDRNLLTNLDTDIQNLTNGLEKNTNALGDNTSALGNTQQGDNSTAWNPFEALTQNIAPQQGDASNLGPFQQSQGSPQDAGLMNALNSLDNTIANFMNMLSQDLGLPSMGSGSGSQPTDTTGSQPTDTTGSSGNPFAGGGQQPLIEINNYYGDSSQSSSSGQGAGSGGFPFPMPFQGGSGSGAGGFQLPGLPNPSDLTGGMPQLPGFPQLPGLPNPGDILGSLPQPPNPLQILNELPKPPIPLPPLPGLGGGGGGKGGGFNPLNPFSIF